MTAFPVGLVSDASSARSANGSALLWRVFAVAAVAIAAIVSIVIARDAAHPTFPYDEIDQLQMGRMIAGLDMPKVTGGGYYPLWSLLITPIWWTTSDPFAVYSATIGLGVVVGLLAIAPLAALARRVRLSSAQGAVAGAVAVTIPAVTLQADYALSERLIFLVLSLTVLTAWRLWEHPSPARAVVFGLMVGALYFTHVRMLAVVLAAGIWLALFALRHWRNAVIGLLVLVTASVAAHYAGRELNLMLLGTFDQGEGLIDTLRASRPGLLLRSAIGQAWAQIAGTFGLVAIGGIALLRWSWRELRHLRAGRATFVLAIVVALFLLTTIKWASDFHLYTRPWRRIDTWLYGRYIDPVAVILVLVAVAVIIRGIRRSTVLWSIAVSVVVIAPAVVWVGREAPLWAYRTPAHVPGIMPWWALLPTTEVSPGSLPTLFNDGRFWIVASATTLIALLAILLLRKLRGILVAGLSIAFAVASIAADGGSAQFRAIEGTPPAGIHQLREALAAEDATVDFDWGCQPDGSRSALAINYYGYWLLPAVVTQINTGRGDAPTADVLISCDPVDGGSLVGTEGRLRVADVDFNGRTVWVRPGGLTERLGDLVAR